MELTEKYLDGLNIVELKDLYMELWITVQDEESETVFNYIKENYPAVIEEEL
jgi:hypothetical protein